VAAAEMVKRKESIPEKRAAGIFRFPKDFARDTRA
jgi:hypothetical protein